MVEILPPLSNCFPYRVGEGSKRVDSYRDPQEAFGFDGLKRHGDPLDVRHPPKKSHLFEFCGLGEVEWGWYWGGS